MLHGGFAFGTVAAERGIDRRVDAFVEGPCTCLLGLPDIDIAQSAVGAADAQVQQGTGQWFGAELVDDALVEISIDRHLLDVGVDHVHSKFVRMTIGSILVSFRAMSEEVKAPGAGKRPYDGTRRRLKAEATRRAVLEAARELFVQQGYTATTIADIATRAGVASDTVYAAVGRKPVLLRELVETSLSGSDHAVPAEQRDYVQQIRAAPEAYEKLTTYARAVTQIQQRLAPVFLALRDAATTDHDCAALWVEISERRARNMRDLAADLRTTGQLRADLSDDEVADIIWSMNAAEYYVLLVHQRGWEPTRFTQWLTDAWSRTLLTPPS